MSYDLGTLWRHLPSNQVYSLVEVEESHYGFYTSQNYIMSPWVESDRNLDMSCSNLGDINWQQIYDPYNESWHCDHSQTSFIGVAGAGYHVCVLCDTKITL